MLIEIDLKTEHGEFQGGEVIDGNEESIALDDILREFQDHLACIYPRDYLKSALGNKVIITISSEEEDIN